MWLLVMKRQRRRNEEPRHGPVMFRLIDFQKYPTICLEKIRQLASHIGEKYPPANDKKSHRNRPKNVEGEIECSHAACTSVKLKWRRQMARICCHRRLRASNASKKTAIAKCDAKIKWSLNREIPLWQPA
jgi:hypothetical protein